MRATVALFLVLLASAASAEVYTWRDASGNVHYSDTPPQGVETKRLRDAMPADAAPTQAPARRSLADDELQFRKRRTEAETARAKAEKEKTESEESKRNCEQARLQLTALESGRRIARVNAQGESIVMDDEARAQQIEQTRKAVQGWCK